MARCAVERCGRWRPDLLVDCGIGTRVDGRWFCSRPCIEQMARDHLTTGAPLAPSLPAIPPMRLGTLLAARGVCDSASLSRALEAQRESGLRLGEQLQVMGAADRQTVLTALATQFGVRCLTSFDPTTVRCGPGGLSRDAVRALRVAPLSDPIEQRVRVASPAPLRRRALSALRRLTGWTLDVYLVTDEDWMAILAHYGTDPRPAARPLPEFVCTSSIDEAAARIAAAAARGREATVIEARWEDHAWIRVEAPGVREDVCLVVPDGPSNTEEVPWLAATTSR